MKNFADDNFKFDENRRKFFKRVENCGKRRNCSLRAISPLLTVFSKDFYGRHVKPRNCYGKSSDIVHPFILLFAELSTELRHAQGSLSMDSCFRN